MKNRWMALPVALIMLAFTSCLNDNDSVEYTYYDFLNVTTGGSSPEFQSDFGNKFKTTFSFPADTFQAGERYYVEYSYGDTTNHPVGEYTINLSEYSKIIPRDIVVWPKDSDDVWENSNFYTYQGIWVSNGYLNAFLQTFASVSEASNSIELIRVKQYESAAPTDTAPLLKFQLRHNAALVYTQLFANRFVSFPLDTLHAEFPAARRIRMEITWSTVSDKYTYVFEYKPVDTIRSVWNALPTHWLQAQPGKRLKALR